MILSTTVSLFTTNILSEAQRVFADEITALQQAQARLSEPFVRAVTTMWQARTVLVFGVGKSGLIGQKISATLTSTGTRATSIHPTDALHGDIGIAEQGDCCLLLSKSGSTAELLALMPTLKRLNLPTIGLLGTLDSPLGHLCDIVLDGSVLREACPLGVAPMSSTTLALVMGDALAAALMRARNFTAEQFADVHAAGQLGKNLTLRVRDVMHSAGNMPVVRYPSTFRQILTEITAKGLGCVCVVDELAHLVGIVTDGDIRRTLEHDTNSDANHHTNLDALTTDDLMTRHPVTTSPEALVGAALAQMEHRTKQINVLPVVRDDGTCVGVVRVHDIVRTGM